MKTILFSLFLFVLPVVNAAAESSAESAGDRPSEHFQTDGCTLIPDFNFRNCCVEHDKAYYAGGSWQKRLRADNRLFMCVAKHKGVPDKLIAPVVWVGVRIGGFGFLPTPFRWGFGQKGK